jgi:hypothetical protein
MAKRKQPKYYLADVYDSFGSRETKILSEEHVRSLRLGGQKVVVSEEASTYRNLERRFGRFL